MKTNYLLFFVLLIFFSCQKEIKEPMVNNPSSFSIPILHSEFPIYLVQKVQFDEFSKTRSATIYFEKDSLMDSIQTNNGISFIFNRYRASLDSPALWKYQATISIQNNSKEYLVNENNEQKVQLIYPFVQNKQWNSNLYNSNKPEILTYVTDNDTLFIKNLPFYKVVTVNGIFEDNLIHKKSAFRQYLPGFGLLVEKIEDLKFDFNTSDTLNGYYYVKTLHQ